VAEGCDVKEGRGKHWNRAGRRSGGYRPKNFQAILPAAAVHFLCPDCGNSDLPDLVTSGCGTCREMAELCIRFGSLKVAAALERLRTKP